jgi:starch synthase
MSILLGSSEVHPYSKTGGLADMVGALAKSLAQAGHDVGVVTPLYRGIRERFPGMTRLDWHMDLPLGPGRVSAEVWVLDPMPNWRIYFIHQPGFYDRPGIYQENGADYPDNSWRYIFLSKAIVHLARYLPSQPEIVHLHDWQTALVPLLMQHQRLAEGWGTIARTCLTLHNLAYQGVFPPAVWQLTNLPPDYFNPNAAEHFGYLNCLKAGIATADVLTTVSPRYAREITTPEFGCGLDGLLRKRQGSLFGILNGVDYEEWRTAGNPFLPHPYSVNKMAGKELDKIELQKELGLPADPKIPLFGSITRLADQKGLDIQLGALEEMLGANLQFVLLGSGAPVYEKAYLSLAKRYPAKVAVRLGFDQALSHRIEAGTDFYLMPSRFEPCGLNQMYSLRYGGIPVVRVTGGLDDSVVDISEDPDRADGIKFSQYSARALAKAIRKALVLYAEPKLLKHYRRNAMTADYSWTRVVEQYAKAYKGALAR